MDMDPSTLDLLKRRAKRQLRQRMRASRGALPLTAIAQRSAAIVERLCALPEVAAARRVASFWPMEGRKEVDLRAMDALLRARGVEVHYPRMTAASGSVAGFARVDAVEELAEAGRGFREPPLDAADTEGGALDVIVVPALAVAADGHRLGYGAGFYDAVLPAFRPPAVAIAVAFDFQLLAELPSTEGDVPCDVIVTDARTLRPTR